MAKCTNCDYPYASGKKCSNCGSDNPSGNSLSKGIGVIGVLIAIFFIHSLTKSGTENNKSSTSNKKNTDTTKVTENTSNTSGDDRNESVNEEDETPEPQNSIPASGTAVASSDIAYFYNEANRSSRNPKYIVKGQEVKYLKTEGDFIYVNFTYANVFTEGWMLISDFENFRRNEVY